MLRGRGRTLWSGEGNAGGMRRGAWRRVASLYSAGIAFVSATVSVVALVLALAGTLEPGVVADDPGGRVRSVQPGGFAWRSGIRPGQVVTAMSSADDAGGWSIETVADGLRVRATADAATSSLRESAPLAGVAVIFGLASLLAVPTRRRRAELCVRGRVKPGGLEPQLALAQRDPGSQGERIRPGPGRPCDTQTSGALHTLTCCSARPAVPGAESPRPPTTPPSSIVPYGASRNMVLPRAARRRTRRTRSTTTATDSRLLATRTRTRPTASSLGRSGGPVAHRSYDLADPLRHGRPDPLVQRAGRLPTTARAGSRAPARVRPAPTASTRSR